MPTGRNPHTNPHWARDELILALDLYFEHKPNSISARHPAVQELSDLLNRLPIHGDVSEFPQFRNPNGVYMKMCNFLRFDRSYGGKGLTKGAQTEQTVWDEFASDRERLRRTAAAIRTSLTAPEAQIPVDEADTDEEFPEGAVLYRLHRSRERNAHVRERAKAQAIKSGKGLRCAVCDFCFEEQYGNAGTGYIECHHLVPVSELVPGQPTKLKDVTLLCSNCHRVIHRRRPWLTLDQLGALLSTSVAARPPR
jgi:5-methylcytosine-specific restriction enzyme A